MTQVEKEYADLREREQGREQEDNEGSRPTLSRSVKDMVSTSLVAWVSGSRCVVFMAVFGAPLAPCEVY